MANAVHSFVLVLMVACNCIVWCVVGMAGELKEAVRCHLLCCCSFGLQV